MGELDELDEKRIEFPLLTGGIDTTVIWPGL